jgi:isoquinoline 1-oxidoreductase alpha subunit
MPALRINGKDHNFDADPNMPLLWAIRDLAGLTGTKFGCGIGKCGACTVHIGGKAARSCQVALSEAEGRDVTTIEGIGEDHPVTRAWVRLNVSACGFCQPGQIMQAAAFLKARPDPVEDDIAKAMAGNLCRCGAYGRILAAIRFAVEGDQ